MSLPTISVEPLIKPNEKEYFDRFGISLASLLSFGEPTLDMDQTSDWISTQCICFVDLKRFPQQVLVGQHWSDLLEPILRLRTEPYEGRKVDALEVRWWNILHSETNPFGDVGQFVARAYSFKDTSTQDPDSHFHL